MKPDAKSQEERRRPWIGKRLSALGCAAGAAIFVFGAAVGSSKAANAGHHYRPPFYRTGHLRHKPPSKRLHSKQPRSPMAFAGSAGAGSAAFLSFFSPTSVWNLPLADSAPLEPGSPTMVSGVSAEVAREEGLGIGPWVAPDAEIYVAGPHQTTVLVRLDDPTPSWRRALQAAFRAVPVPPDAQPASDADADMTVWQPSSDKLWEFFHMRRLSDGWHAAWGGAIKHVSQNPGYYDAAAWPGASTSWGATASSLPLAAGVVTLGDIKEGAINHALAVDLPYPCQDIYSWPAQRTDGTGTAANCIPEGAHLRLDPRLNIPGLHLPAFVQMMAEAAQKYGIIVRNQTHWDIAFWIQDPAPTGDNPFYTNGAPNKHGPFQGMWPNQLLSYFPWSALQVLKMNLHNMPGSG